MTTSNNGWVAPSIENGRLVNELDLSRLKVTQLKDLIRDINGMDIPGFDVQRINMSGAKAELIKKINIRLSSLSQRQLYDSLQSHMTLINSYMGTTNARVVHGRSSTSSARGPYAAVVLNRQDQGSSQTGYNSNGTWWDKLPFKSSPFYEPVERVSFPKICSEARDIRSSISLDVQLSEATRNALQKPKDDTGRQMQLRFFCKAVDVPNTSAPALMEYPPICELKVNGRVVSGSLRGLKNKPGTVNPPNITSLVYLNGNRNQVELVYANTQKRYAAAVVLVKSRSVESIVEEIKSTRFVTKQETLNRIRARNADSDIVVGSSTISIKCPLGFIRINLPCRSRLCNHIQCFDVYTFFHMNEQTPTWTCPVCTNVINSWEDLVIDGYFSDILQNTPQDQEAVVVEEDGVWRLPKDPSSRSLSSSPQPSSHKRSASALRDNTPATSLTEEVTVIDDEDDIQNTPAASIKSTDTPVSQRSSSKKQRTMEVIDLTLSSDEEEKDDNVAKKAQPDPAPQSASEEAPVKAEVSHEGPNATPAFSNGAVNILPPPTTGSITNGHSAYINNLQSWPASNSPTGSGAAQPNIEPQALWLPSLRSSSGSPGHYQTPTPLRNLSPMSNSSQLSQNSEWPMPSVSRLVLNGWNGHSGERAPTSERNSSTPDPLRSSTSELPIRPGLPSIANVQGSFPSTTYETATFRPDSSGSAAESSSMTGIASVTSSDVGYAAIAQSPPIDIGDDDLPSSTDDYF
ncbi:E3 SUMO-protein ligase pli1 [Umbelopsis sp. WA50703]